VRPVRRDHGPRPDRRDGSVNMRHSANAPPATSISLDRGAQSLTTAVQESEAMGKTKLNPVLAATTHE
jgi:hypothetical protein